MKTFISKLKELREEKGIQQKELAEILNVSKSTVSGWEVGRNEPNQEMLIKIATYFDVTTDFLLGKEDDFGNVTLTSGDVLGNNNTVNSNNTIHARSATLSPFDSELLRKYHSAPAELRKAIDKLLS
ncbi:helix-turn-helix domain-containing protein [Pumilibacter muris]|uniref:helix-turn-helix domain-containing protein n=1 Tax=Pumilibacter muris TaxID=2941510 RepID=UPI0020402EA7|nr:helix-turn-helix transcriptional regulator [Pumilibacter muris]